MISVIIRYSGERTLSLARALIEQQVDGRYVFVTPSFSTFNDCFIYCIYQTFELRTKYVAFIDADLIIRPNVIKRLVDCFESLGDDYFTISTFTLDKFHLGKKSGGIHIYRTVAFKKLQSHVSQLLDKARPETYAKNLLVQIYELKIFNLDLITSMHDFYQFRRDIIRKISFRMIKSSELRKPYLRKYSFIKYFLADFHLAYQILIETKVNLNAMSSRANVAYEKFIFTEKKDLANRYLYYLHLTNIPYIFWRIFFRIVLYGQNKLEFSFIRIK